MNHITPEGKSRLDLLEYLIDQVSRTYPQRVTLQQLSEDTGIPRTNLHKWLVRQVNPRESTYKAAVEALEKLLEERKGLPQGTVQNAHAELFRASDSFVKSTPKPIEVSDYIQIRISRLSVWIVVSSFIGASIGFFFGSIAGWI